MLNQCTFIGRLGADPEMRATQQGKQVANFRIAVSEKWKDKDGNKQEKTEWVPLVFFGRQAEVCGEYLHKGSLVYVSGKLQTRKWQDKDGNDRYTTEVIGREMTMLGGKGEKQEQQDAPQQTADFDDDIPF